MNTLFHSILEVVRTEYRRCGQDDGVNHVDYLLICIETYEASIVGYYLVVLLGKHFLHIVESVFKYIAQCDNLYTVGSLEKVVDCARATSAASYETYFNLFAFDGLVREFRQVVFACFSQRFRTAISLPT